MGSICLLRLTCLARADAGKIVKLQVEQKCRCVVDLMRSGYARWPPLCPQWVERRDDARLPAACTLTYPCAEVGYCALTLEVMDAITSEALLKAASRLVIW